jgi:hypothetical protein
VAGNLAYGDLDFTTVTTCTQIVSHAFYQCGSIKSVTLGSQITSIGQSAFRECYGLKYVNLTSADKLEVISNFAFCDDKQLQNIVLPRNLTTLGTSAFQGCSSLLKVETALNQKLVTIGKSCFTGCENLIEFVCPTTVSEIDDYAFSACTKLSYVTFLPNHFESLGAYIFTNCIGLTHSGSYLMFVNINDPKTLSGVISPVGMFDTIVPNKVYVSDTTNATD